MARDTEDKDARESQSKPNNPFIKFRQFADEQISSLLQGIIGLPSAFSKPSGNTRWADFDDELRRRDELQARQKELKESEARRAAQGTQSEKSRDITEIPVKHSGWSKPSAWNPDCPTTDQGLPTTVQEVMVEKIARDPPLYSPVSRSLFAHLDSEDSTDKSWAPLSHPFSWDGIMSRGACFGSSFSDPIKHLGEIVFSNLNQSPVYRSEYSLLPYLLFSPYSPLKLTSDDAAAKSKTRLDPPEVFPYCDAFEDLILASQGNPMTNLLRPPTSYRSIFSPNSPYFGVNYIDGLRMARLLQQKEERSEWMITEKSLLDKYSFPQSAKDDSHTQDDSLKSRLSQLKQDEPRTEEEMYDRFLRLMSPSTVNLGGTILESLFADIEQEFGKEIKDLKDLKPDMVRIIKPFVDAIKTLNPEEEQALRSQAEDFWRDFIPSFRADFEQASKGRVLIAPKVMSAAEKNAIHAAVFNPTTDSERVVSTTTTTEHTIDEDGTVETSVTVWKRFADGRETTTTTEHIEEPSRDEEGNPTERYPAAQPAEEDTQEKKKKPVKKGWFWN